MAHLRRQFEITRSPEDAFRWASAQLRADQGDKNLQRQFDLPQVITIPAPGTEFVLAEDWSFELENACWSENSAFIANVYHDFSDAPSCPVVLPAGIKLAVASKGDDFTRIKIHKSPLLKTPKGVEIGGHISVFNKYVNRIFCFLDKKTFPYEGKDIQESIPKFSSGKTVKEFLDTEIDSSFIHPSPLFALRRYLKFDGWADKLTYRDIIKHSEKKLLSIPDVGRRTVNKLKEQLSLFDLELKESL